METSEGRSHGAAHEGAIGAGTGDGEGAANSTAGPEDTTSGEGATNSTAEPEDTTGDDDVLVEAVVELLEAAAASLGSGVGAADMSPTYL